VEQNIEEDSYEEYPSTGIDVNPDEALAVAPSNWKKFSAGRSKKMMAAKMETATK